VITITISPAFPLALAIEPASGQGPQAILPAPARVILTVP
jgi:hypothetical protein